MSISPAPPSNTVSDTGSGQKLKKSPRQVLAITLLGAADTSTLQAFDHSVCETGSTIYAAQVIRLGQLFGMLIKAGGAWNTLNKLQNVVPKFAQKHQLQYSMELTSLDEPVSEGNTNSEAIDAQAQAAVPTLPYAIEIIAVHTPGLMEAVSQFCARRGLQITELVMNPYVTAHSATSMVSLNVAILVPARQPIAALREDFMDFSDSMNFDAIIEPLKH